MNPRCLTLLFSLTCLALPAYGQEKTAQAPPQINPQLSDAGVTNVPKRITLKDGQKLMGYITRKDDTLLVRLKTGQTVIVPQDAVASIAEVDAIDKDRRTTHRTRYLYSPSGMMLREGEGYISQKELFFTSLAFGLTDWLSLVVGGALPFWVVEDGFNLIGGLKIGGSPIDWVHTSVGVEGIALPGFSQDGTFGALLFGNITIGDPLKPLTLNLGKPLGSEGLSDVWITTISGYYAFNQTVGVVSENWIVRTEDNFNWFGSLALRFTPGNFSIDAGAILLEGFEVPIPWVDFSWGFGG